MSTSSRPPTGPKSHAPDPSAAFVAPADFPANPEATPAAPPPDDAPTAAPARPSLDWSSPPAVQQWAAELRTQVDDAIAAGLDATAPPAERDLGRRLARSNIREAATAVRQLFAFAVTARQTPS
jgi:hypothetical protein